MSMGKPPGRAYARSQRQKHIEKRKSQIRDPRLLEQPGRLHKQLPKKAKRGVR